MLEETLKKIKWYLFIILIFVVLITTLALFKSSPEQPVGSVSVTSEYNATTTAPSAVAYLNANNPLVIKKGSGTFGSVIVLTTGTAGGTMNFYDATTTNALQRSADQATSSIIITSLPTNLAAGTYTFDVNFNRGLLMFSTGTVGTSTITSR